MATKTKRMGYREAIDFACLNGERLEEAYDYGTENQPDPLSKVVEQASGDIMTWTIAHIFGKDPLDVARTIILKQRKLK